jgi:hypothetical protein
VIDFYRDSRSIAQCRGYCCEFISCVYIYSGHDNDVLLYRLYICTAAPCFVCDSNKPIEDCCCHLLVCMQLLSIESANWVQLYYWCHVNIDLVLLLQLLHCRLCVLNAILYVIDCLMLCTFYVLFKIVLYTC